MLWKDLFPTREEYAARGGPRINPPGGETEPAGTRRITRDGTIIESTGYPGIMWRVVGTVGEPASRGTQRMMHYGGQPHTLESSGRAGIMPRMMPAQRCPTCGQIQMPKPTPIPMNAGSQLRRFL